MKKNLAMKIAQFENEGYVHLDDAPDMLGFYRKARYSLIKRICLVEGLLSDGLKLWGPVWGVDDSEDWKKDVKEALKHGNY